MKKLRINHLHLEQSREMMSLGDKLKAIKLPLKIAMSFSNKSDLSFSEMLSVYGSQNQMHEGEYYNGYAIIFYGGGNCELVHMRGILKKSDPENQKDVNLWKCTIPSRKEEKKGEFCSIMNVRDCLFAEQVQKLQQNGQLSYIDAQTFETSLKEKLIQALTKEEKIALVSEDEVLVLRQYFGKRYPKIFIETKS